MRRRTPKLTGISSGLRRLGLATPPPFVGRREEMARIGQGLREAGTLVVHGAVGSGKTRLANEIERRPDVVGGFEVTYVRCRPGDRSVAIRARAERALDALPGTLADVLHESSCLLIIDDAHHLPEEDAVHMLAELVSDSGQGRATGFDPIRDLYT